MNFRISEKLLYFFKYNLVVSKKLRLIVADQAVFA